MSWSRFGSRSSRSRYESWTPFPTYVSVADRRAQAAAQVNRMAKLGHAVAPVVVSGSVIAHTVWGKAWCKALESHADLANRLGRGRSYVRHGCVVDLQPSTGLVTALISGSEVYHANVTFEPLPPARWQAIVAACRGQIRSMVELLQGKLSTEVMAVVCRPGEGLFPRIGEMKMRCSCPDSAWMCKHLAAVLYGIGHRLDQQPEMLFTLRGVDPSELIAAAPLPALADDDPRSLGDADLASLFGVSLDETSGPMSQLPPSSAAGASPFAPVVDLPPVSLVLPPPVAVKKPAKKPAGKPAKAPGTKAVGATKKPASTTKTPATKKPASTAKKPTAKKPAIAARKPAKKPTKPGAKKPATR